jgi:hypothetical protein
MKSSLGKTVSVLTSLPLNSDTSELLMKRVEPYCYLRCSSQLPGGRTVSHQVRVHGYRKGGKIFFRSINFITDKTGDIS